MTSAINIAKKGIMADQMEAEKAQAMYWEALARWGRKNDLKRCLISLLTIMKQYK